MEEIAERVAHYARQAFETLDECGRGGDCLPLWHFASGDWIGAGDFPRACADKGTAKRLSANQVRRDGRQASGYVAVRDEHQIRVFEIGSWTSQDGYQTDPDCWQKPLFALRRDGHPLWEVTIAGSGPRARLSPLAERLAA